MRFLIASLLLWSTAAVGEEHFACKLKALTTAEREHHRELSEQLFSSVEARRELPNGYAFQLPSAHWMRAAEWISLEHRCCPFFHFSLEQPRDSGPLQLQITGGEGVKRFLRAELSL